MPKPSVNDVMGPDDSYQEKVIRVPLVKIVLPNPAGTSIDKYEPEYVLPLLLDLWAPRFAQNSQLKPKIGKVPPHLPQYRDITGVEDERGRLASSYGNMRSGDETRVDHFLGGDKLWTGIQKCGGEIGVREVTTHHSFHLADTFDRIPATAQPFDVLDELPFNLEFEGEEADQDVDTEVSLAAKAAAEKASKDRLERMAKREAMLARRAMLERKAKEAKARAEAVASGPAPKIASEKPVEGDNGDLAEVVIPDADDLADIDAQDKALDDMERADQAAK
jgi:hypothetical protein